MIQFFMDPMEYKHATISVAGLWHADICFENPQERVLELCELHQGLYRTKVRECYAALDTLFSR